MQTEGFYYWCLSQAEYTHSTHTLHTPGHQGVHLLPGSGCGRSLAASVGFRWNLKVQHLSTQTVDEIVERLV